MIKTLVMVILVLLYFEVGHRFFIAGINLMGGKEKFLSEAVENYPNLNTDFLYLSAVLLMMLFWPYFIIKSIFERSNKN